MGHLIAITGLLQGASSGGLSTTTQVWLGILGVIGLVIAALIARGGQRASGRDAADATELAAIRQAAADLITNLQTEVTMLRGQIVALEGNHRECEKRHRKLQESFDAEKQRHVRTQALATRLAGEVALLRRIVHLDVKATGDEMDAEIERRLKNGLDDPSQ